MTLNTSNLKMIDYLWLFLITLTLLSAYIAERSSSGLISILIMSAVLAIKGRIIVDHFMELKNANKVLRTLMRVYFYVIPSFIILVYLFPETIAKWTAL